MSAQVVTQQELAAALKDLATKHDLAEAIQQNKRDLAEATQQNKRDLAETTQQNKRDLADAAREITEKLTEAIRDSQTEVLRAFYNWARPIEIRLNRTDEIATRLSLIEERVGALERGKFPTSH